MRINKIWIAAFLFLSLALTACQPTPTDTAIVDRRDEIDESLLLPFSQYTAPARVNETLTFDGTLITITFDADVKLPVCAALSVFTLKQKRLSVDEALNLFRYFYPDKTLYKVSEAPKADIAKIILALRKGYMIDGERHVSEDSVAYYEQLWEAAPEEKELIPLSVADYADTDSSMSAEFANEFGSYGFFYAQIGGNSVGVARWNDSLAQPETWVLQGNAYAGEPKGTTIPAPLITQEQATQNAYQILDELGIENLRLCHVEKARVFVGTGEEKAKTNGWGFDFRKIIDGQAVPYDERNYSINPAHLPEVVAPWQPERLFILLDETGAVIFDWEGMTEVSAVQAEDIPILNFESLMQRVQNQFKYSLFSPGYRTGITITDIVLGASNLSVANNPAIGEYTPTWYVYYYLDEYPDTSRSCMMFDARNGAYVEPRMTVIEKENEMSRFE